MASHIFQHNKNMTFFNLFHYVHHFIHSYFLIFWLIFQPFSHMTTTLESFSDLRKAPSMGCCLHDAWELRGWKLEFLYPPGFPITYISPTKVVLLSWWFSEFPVWWDRFPASLWRQAAWLFQSNSLRWFLAKKVLEADLIRIQRRKTTEIRFMDSWHRIW